MPKNSTVIIISYYAKRPIDALRELLGNLAQAPEKDRCPVIVVVNRIDDKPLSLDYPGLQLNILYRNNVGMNIGAWDHGWRCAKEFSQIVFLQDDCYPIRSGWLSAITEKLNDPRIGMIGESVNTSWDYGWDYLRERECGVLLPEHGQEHGIENRIDLYLLNFQKWKVKSGDSGSHLRALIWAAKTETLNAIDGFPIGSNYGECIAAEIATSKKVEQIGLRVCQIEEQPFYYFKHTEWNQVFPGGEYSKLSARDKKIKKLETDNEKLAAQLHRVATLSNASRWRQLAEVLSGRFKSQLKSVINEHD